MEKYTQIGKNLLYLRKENNMTQEKVAEFLGINRVEVSYYENGTRKIPVDILNKFSDLYNIKLIEIIEMNEESRKIKSAMAFRTNDINKINYEIIADFNRIVKNYLKMKNIENRK